MRIFLKIAYDGTNYNGFQSQKNGVGIQDLINAAAGDLFKKEIKTIGGSRTDAGVHARGNVTVFDVETRIDPSKIAFAMNARLPEDIRIVESKQVRDSFHPRYQDTVKTYTYHILNRVHPDPLTRNIELHYYYPLDADAMNRAAQYIVGEHDFAAFAAAGNSTKTTVRTIYRSDVRREGDRVVFTVIGNGFLYNMVRILAGTLLAVGGGKIPAEEMQEILLSGDRGRAADTAPAKGLILEEIRYPQYEM